MKTVEDLSYEHAREAVRRILATTDGRELAWELLDQAGVYRLSYAGDPYETAFREGRRSIGTWFLDLLFQVAPDEYARLRAEAAARAEYFRARIGALHEAPDQVE